MKKYLLVFGILITGVLFAVFYLKGEIKIQDINPLPILTETIKPTLAPTSVIGRGKCDIDPELERQGKCPPGCAYYGMPLGCVTQETYDNCKKPGANCPICLSSSTTIDTEKGPVNVKDVKEDMLVWTVNNKGEKKLQPILKLSSVNVGNNHKMSHITLKDGRELLVSPNHPTADGRLVHQLKVGDTYDSSIVRTMVLVLYTDTKTYDLLPAGDTGYYFANGILMGSTLK